MSDVPSNLIPTRITQLPVAPVADENSLMMIVYQGNNYQIRVGDLLSVAGVPTSRAVLAGTGLDGGGQLSSNVTLSIAPGGVGTTELANTGVTPGVYGTATTIPVFTVDETGRVTAATTIPATISGYVPTTRQVIAGAGLSGGGALSADVTLDANLSNAAPLVLDDTGSAGVSDDIARADHQHPAVDLSDQQQINGILPMDQGGTSRSLVPSSGGIVWSGADGLYIGPAGVYGEVLVSNGLNEYIWASIDVDVPRPANTVRAGPVSGPDAIPTFRLLVNDDIPDTLDGKTLTNVDINSGTIDGTVIGGATPAAGTFTSVDTDYVDFAPALSPLPTDATGRVYYDNNDQFQTLAFQMNGSVVQHVGEEQFYRIKCQGSITKGQVVMFAGTVGASGGLIGAAATGLTPEQSNYLLGVADESGINNDWIFVTNFGEVKNINTTGGAENWVQGQVLYYNPAVTGGLTKNKPTAPNAIAVVAAVVYVGVSNGILFVRPTYGSVLGGTDGNVQFGTLNNGDVIVYDSTDQRWENVAQSGLAVGSATNVAGGAANKIVYNTGASTTNFIDAPTVASTFLQWSGSAFQWSSAGAGTVTSVGLSLPAEFTVSNSPVTSSGTLTGAWANATANYVFAGPTTGSPGTPSFRALVAADVPTLNQNTTGSAASLSVVGQTGLFTVTGITTTNRIKTVRDADDTILELGGSYTPTGTWNWTTATATWPTFNQNTTGSAGSVANAATFNTSGGAAPGTTFDGSAARTIDYSTVGAPKADGTGASGTWGISISGNAATATSSTNIAGGTAGALPYNTGAGATTFLSLGTTNYVLTAGATAPQYVDQSTLSVGTATNATNVATTTTSTNADFYIPFVAASTTSNQALGVDAGITYNPSTNAITAGISGGTF
jgi:hypothetical protein